MHKGNQFGVEEKGKYVTTKTGADSMKYGGMSYKNSQSGTVKNTQNPGDSMPTPKANVQMNHGGKSKY